jgi:exopolyphosphatase/pppGpp-phosphohydrolase
MHNLGLDDYGREAAHHFVLPRGSVQHRCSTLAGESLAASTSRNGLVAGREGVIVGGLLVLQETMTCYGFAHGLVQSLTGP